jgi:hypothetical protein
LSERPEWSGPNQEADMAKTKKTEAAAVADIPVRTTPIETAPVAVTESPAKPKRKKAAEVEPRDLERTLATIFAGYLASLDERGGSAGTIASYRMELDLAGKALAIDTPASALTDAQVAAYFESDSVTRKQNGKPKSPLSIDKTRRVLRQALVWAGHADLVPSMEAAS